MQNQFKILLDKIKDGINLICLEAAKSHRQYCTDMRFNRQCQNKSYYQCTGSSSQLFEILKYPKEQTNCINDGVKISGASGIDLPNKIYPEDASDDQKHLICDSLRLDQIFKKVKTNLTNQITHCYVGFSNGLYRIFPSFNRNCTKPYDCRNRPWYTSATTGMKKVAIVIDVSSSMGPYKNQVKEAVIGLIQTLGINDFLSIAFQKNTTQFSFYQELQRGTSTRISQFEQMIENLVISNQTNLNFETAFEKLGSLFKNVKNDIYGSPCSTTTNIAIFITSNLPNQGANTSTDLISKIKTWNQNINMKLFFYAMKPLQNFDLLKTLSNEFEGVAFDMSRQQRSLKHLLRFFETALSSSINVDEMVFSQPYVDAFTGQKMITLSKPAYTFFFGINGKRNITLVVGIDIPMKYLKKYEINQQKIVKQLIKCPIQSVKFDPCYLNHLRPQYSKIQSLSCPSYPDQIICNRQTNFTVLRKDFVPNQTSQFRGCAGLSNMQFALSIVLPLVFLIFVIVLFVKMWKKYHSNRIDQQKVAINEQRYESNLSNRRMGCPQQKVMVEINDTLQNQDKQKSSSKFSQMVFETKSDQHHLK